MTGHWRFYSGVLLFALVSQTASQGAGQRPSSDDLAVSTRTAVVDGLELQYLSAGHGPAIVLLHGYAETSRMWRPLIPRLAETHTVIAPDLPGIGGSAIPADGLDMTQAAVRMHALVRSLGVNKAAVVGHDIGLMVAYAYAAQFPDDVDRLVLMDAFLPGVEGWEAIYNSPAIWHFRFNGPTAEALVRGRERTYFEHFWNDFGEKSGDELVLGTVGRFCAMKRRSFAGMTEEFSKGIMDHRSGCSDARRRATTINSPNEIVSSRRAG